MRRRRYPTVLAWVGAALLLAAVVDADTLNTDDIIGTWVGSCTQMETGAVTQILGFFSHSLGGGPPQPNFISGRWTTEQSFFGCPPADPGLYVLSRNHKPSGFTDHSIRIKSESVDPFGKLSIRTKGAQFKVRGRKACDGNGPKKYGGTGTLNGAMFTLDFSAKIQGETAHFHCAWTRVSTS